MKVLMTGMTLTQTGDVARMRLKYKSNPQCLEEALRKAGHEVDIRPVTPGESLVGYDCMIVGLANALSFGSKYRLGALWSISQPLPRAYLVDDWNFKGIWHSIRGLLRRPDYVFKEELPTKWLQESIDHQLEIYDGVLQLTERAVEPLIGNFCDWGNLDRFREGQPIGEIWGFDASIAQPVYDGDPLSRGHKEFKWIAATLTPQAKWIWGLDLRWPIEIYGPSSHEKKYLSDRDLYLRMEEVWGVLSPRYYHAGSGWQRPRYKYAADAGCILLADPEEVAGIGESYVIPHRDRRGLEERSSHSELGQIADWQREEYYAWMWSEEKLVQWARELPSRICSFRSTS